MNRRTFLRVGAGIAGTATVAGCIDVDDVPGLGSGEPPLVEDRPDAVYYPTHVEGMDMIGMGEAGGYTVALSYSYPHRLWLVTGQARRKVSIRDEDSVHLMATVWDPETGLVPPNANLSVEITQDGETVVEKSLWAMLSQNMGFHFGDNVALDGDGTYEVEMRIGPLDTRRTGSFQGTFDESVTTSFTFEFSESELDDVTYERLDDRQGDRGAVDPMEMDAMPLAQLPPSDDLPGEVLGEATSGDGVFVVSVLEEPPAGVDDDGAYLVVSARTPYNRYPLPFMSLSATVTRDGETLFDGECTPTLDPDLDYHYGAVVDDVEPGDDLRLSVDAPPQVSRHEGYETAFLDMPEMELTLS